MKILWGIIGNCMPNVVNPRIMHAKKGIKKNTVSGVATHANWHINSWNACQLTITRLQRMPNFISNLSSVQMHAKKAENRKLVVKACQRVSSTPNAGQNPFEVGKRMPTQIVLSGNACKHNNRGRTFGNACQNVHHVNKRMPTRLLNESWPLVQRGKKVSF